MTAQVFLFTPFSFTSKMLGVIVALLVAFAGSQKYNLEPGFSNSKTYLYRYGGLILNGLPESDFKKSGLRLTCEVEVSRVSQEEHILKPRIEGTCLTKYIIEEDRENNQATISQTRDLNNCTDKVVKNVGMAYVRPCPTCPVKARNVAGTVVLTQKLKYMGSGALIIRAESQQVYEISPFNEPDGTAVMEARQHLTLIDVEHNQERIPEIQLENHGNLYYQFAEDLPPMALHLIKPESPEARDLIASPGVQKSLLLYKLAHLAYGSMPLHDLATAAANKNHEEDIVLALKAIGNAGEPASFKYIKRFLPGSSAANTFSERIHGNAIRALRKIARKEAAKVGETVFQIFLDRSLQPWTRMMACMVFFETKPALPLVMAMANFLQKESSLQVANFAYSHMKVLAVGGIPQLENLATACSIAVKLLSLRFDQRILGYSKVIQITGYNSNYRAGAIGRLYLNLHNSPALPSSFVAKIRGYYDTSAMDIVEVAFQLNGLTDLLRGQDAPFAQYSTFKKLKEFGKLLHGWKELPSEKPLLLSYIKLFSHEIAYGSVDKELLQPIMKFLTKPEEMQVLLQQMMTLFQKGLRSKWTHPVWVGELRHMVPTVLGFPLEFGLYSASIMHTAANVKGHISAPLTGTFRPEQLIEAKVQFRTDIDISVHTHVVATMGINTPYFQNGLEFHAKFNASLPVKFDARIDMKEESLKLETIPIQETELLAARTKLYAISRNMDEPDLTKKSPVLPQVAGLDVFNEQWKTSESERGFKDGGIKGSNPSGLVAVLRTIRDDEMLTWFRLALCADLHSLKPTVQVVMSDFQGSRQMKLCADVSLLDSQRAEGALKWGQDCQDYKIATQVTYGQYGGHPAMQFKLEWPKIPSVVQAAARRLVTYIPGIAYVLGFIQKQQKNPTQEASVVVALTSPQICQQQTEEFAMQPHGWSFISDVPPAILENLKVHCSVSQDTVRTFNDVSFNYTMPEHDYQILTQDCSSELKFQVTAKNSDNPNEGKIIHITLANQ
ncbi:hypothetical protein lerEdw1_003947 [Lerista edwardsae]|nr:hypothetical protein lerEdw1_003947 [Lerista edwardsae]